MKVERRGKEIRLTGYVCAAGRESRVLHHPVHGDFVETVEPGTFARALAEARNVAWTIDHGRELGSTQQGNLTLEEDAIGLKASARTDDAAVVQAAERGELRGWSFTFRAKPGGDVWEDGKDGQPARRSLRDILLDEVAVLDITPAYICYGDWCCKGHKAEDWHGCGGASDENRQSEREVGHCGVHGAGQYRRVQEVHEYLCRGRRGERKRLL